jgi:3-oxoacyl-[acyl-carrier protein] reductase
MATASAFDAILDEFKRIDILVNNAGVVRDDLLLRMKEDDWTQVLQINLTGMFHCCKAVIRSMLRQRSGRIVNMTSIIGIVGNPGQINYAAAKAGAIGLTKSLAREVASRGITVNAVAPGFIETEMTQGVPAEAKAEILRRIPLARWGTPQDVAECVGFLVSARASYITGQVIQVNGGLSM